MERNRHFYEIWPNVNADFSWRWDTFTCLRCLYRGLRWQVQMRVSTFSSVNSTPYNNRKSAVLEKGSPGSVMGLFLVVLSRFLHGISPAVHKLASRKWERCDVREYCVILSLSFILPHITTPGSNLKELWSSPNFQDIPSLHFLISKKGIHHSLIIKAMLR